MAAKTYKSKSDLPINAKYSVDYLFYSTKGNANKAQDLVLKKLSKLVKSISRLLGIPKCDTSKKNSFELSKSLVSGCKNILHEL